MTETQVERIVEELSREQKRLQERLTALKAELAEIEAALARVNGALDALRGKGKGKGTRKPAATKQEVISLIESVLGKKQPLSRCVLKRKVEETLLASGKSRMGFALRFKEALAEAQFVETQDGIQMEGGPPTERLCA